MEREGRGTLKRNKCFWWGSETLGAHWIVGYKHVPFEYSRTGTMKMT